MVFFTLSARSQSVVKADILRSDTTFYIWNKNYTGYIFPAAYKDVNGVLGNNEKFTPVEHEIDETEAALAKLYEQPTIISGHKLYGGKALVDVTPGFSNYKRQYAGYINDKKQKIVCVNILNFRNKKEAEQHFRNWKHRFFIGFDGFYEHNYTCFGYNLSTQKIETLNL